jgi:hypothetical protein
MFKPLPISDDELGIFWSQFPNSRPQRALHNELLAMVDGERDLLEKADNLDAMHKHQANLHAFRRLLAVLHSRDNR